MKLLQGKFVVLFSILSVFIFSPLAQAAGEYQKGFDDANTMAKYLVNENLFFFNVSLAVVYDTLGEIDIFKDVKKKDNPFKDKPYVLTYKGNSMYGNVFDGFVAYFIHSYNVANQMKNNPNLPYSLREIMRGYADGIYPFSVNPMWFLGEPKEPNSPADPNKGGQKGPFDNEKL